MIPMNVDQAFRIAQEHHQAGHFAEAERIYRHILMQQPNHADALHLLGLLASQVGRLDAAVELIRRAITLKPDCAEAHGNLGNIFKELGQLEEAIASYRQAIRWKPDLAGAYSNLGNVLRNLGRLDEAIASLRQAIRLAPDYAEVHTNLGIALQDNGQLEDAIVSHKHAIRLKPECAEAHFNLGIAYKDNGQFDEAIASNQQAIRLKPDLVEAHNNLGVLFEVVGRHDEAIASCEQAIRLKPDYADAHYNLGIALESKGLPAEAIAAYRQAIRLRPEYAEAYNNLGNAFREIGRLNDSAAAFRKAIALKPNLAEAHSNLGNTLRELEQVDEAIASQRRAIGLKPDYANAYDGLGNTLYEVGQLDEAIGAYRQAIALKPDDAGFHSNLLFTLNYHPDIGAEAILAEHRAWSERHARRLVGEIVTHANELSPDRRLRIGYVSPDFRRHSVGYFFIPLLEQHDRRILEIFCYSNVQCPDELTERMKRCGDVWRNIFGLSDQAVAQLIRSDGIDILVDMSGHTAGNRLRVFARKPVPIQVTYLGYANTTGMTTIDYRLTDALADPPGTTDELNAEKLWRLPMCAWCYQPITDAPDIRARASGPVTFGCFNAFPKINPKLVAIWAELLKRVPGSHLLLKSAGAGEISSRQRLNEQFAEFGISRDRIKMRGRIAVSRGHLALYGLVDVALDTYPYHGTTTTCEALWMGVPVVSWAGRAHVSRVGVSLLTHAGLPEFIAQTPAEYISIASKLATDRPRLDALRTGMRSMLQSSPLMDAPRFARDVEAAYREMCRKWTLAPISP
jgi:predicted O-linked N-acetylglucosamine transferase (SPINDLY family)